MSNIAWVRVDGIGKDGTDKIVTLSEIRRKFVEVTRLRRRCKKLRARIRQLERTLADHGEGDK